MEHVFPPMLRGLVSSESRSLNLPGACLRADNTWPTTTGQKVRGGNVRHATVGDSTSNGFIRYQSGAQKKLFAGFNGSIFDVTAPTSASVIPTAVISGFGAGEISHQIATTGGGEFVIAVNGTQTHLIYNGATWAQNTPAITGVTSEKFTQVWSYKERLFFAVKNELAFAYLPVNSIGGAATKYTLNAVCNYGGSVLFGATQSSDSGDGQDDRCVVVTSEGEVLIFAGTNPGSATEWKLLGRHDMPRPLGKNSWKRVGGDLLINTVAGPISLSEVTVKDAAALKVSSVLAAILPDWSAAVSTYGTSPNWEIEKWPEGDVAIFAVPSTAPAMREKSVSYAVNLTTKGITRIVGWDIQRLISFNGSLYFADSLGGVFKADVTGRDDGNPYNVSLLTWYDDFGATAKDKSVKQLAAVFQYSTNFNARVAACVNYIDEPPVFVPSAFQETSGSTWGSMVWGSIVWSKKGARRFKREWVQASRKGYSVAAQVSMVMDVVEKPDIELREIVATYEMGGTVTQSTEGVAITKTRAPRNLTIIDNEGTVIVAP